MYVYNLLYSNSMVKKTVIDELLLEPLIDMIKEQQEQQEKQQQEDEEEEERTNERTNEKNPQLCTHKEKVTEESSKEKYVIEYNILLTVFSLLVKSKNPGL